MYAFQINHEKFVDVIIFDDVNKKSQFYLKRVFFERGVLLNQKEF